MFRTCFFVVVALGGVLLAMHPAEAQMQKVATLTVDAVLACLPDGNAASTDSLPVGRYAVAITGGPGVSYWSTPGVALQHCIISSYDVQGQGSAPGTKSYAAISGLGSKQNPASYTIVSLKGGGYISAFIEDIRGGSSDNYGYLDVSVFKLP